MPVQIGRSAELAARRRLATVAFLAAAALAILWLLPDHWLSFDFVKAQRVRLVDLFAARPWQTAGVFIALYVTCAVLLIPSAAVLNLAAGAIFGLAWGLPLVLVSATLGATLAFLAARYLGRDLVRQHLGGPLAAFNRGIERDGALYLFALRLVALAPYVLINPVMGLTTMRLRTFVWVSFLGMIPVLAVYLNAGTRLGQVERPAELFAPGVLLSLALVGLLPLIGRYGIRLWRRRRASGL